MRPHYAYTMREHSTLQRWLAALPDATLEQHPRLCVHAAFLLLFSWGGQGRTDCRPATLAQIERLLHCAECTWQAEENRSGLGQILSFRALISREQGELARGARRAREALASTAEAAEGEASWRSICLRIIGEEELLAGRASAARQLFQEALALYAATENSYAIRATQLLLAEAYLLQGALHQAAELYRAARASAGEDLFDTSQAQLGLARLFYEWNLLEESWQEAQKALDLGRQIEDETLQVQAALVLATIEQARGETTAAQQRLRVLFAWLPAMSPHLLLFQRRIEAMQARLALAAGDLATAERWFAMSAPCPEGLPRLHQEQEEFIVARLLIAQGKTEEALRLLEGWQVEAQETGRIRSEVESLVLIARAAFAQQRQFYAFSRLRTALSLAQAEGYLRLFLDEGEAMVALLRAALPTLRMNHCESYVRMLLRTFAQLHLEQGAAFALNNFDLTSSFSALSPQEQRVLRLLLAGYSNPEIAETLVVSVNTVKTQVRSIYRKLGVKSRKEAREAMRNWPPVPLI